MALPSVPPLNLPPGASQGAPGSASDTAPAPPPAALSDGLGEGARRQLKRAVAALARREFGRSELQRKLLRGLEDDSPGDLAEALDRLQSRGLLSDNRMANALARTRAVRYGRRRIEQELERRGVDADTIAAALPSEAQDAVTALALWRRRFGTLPQNHAERNRQGRFLTARGFSASLVARILSGRVESSEGSASDMPDSSRQFGNR